MLQRDKGRDLFDLAHGLNVFQNLDTSRVVQGLGFHLDRSGQRTGRAEAERRMFTKLRKPAFMGDVRPLLPAAEAANLTDEAIDAAFTLVFGELIARLPGAPWSRTPEMADRFGIEVA